MYLSLVFYCSKNNVVFVFCNFCFYFILVKTIFFFFFFLCIEAKQKKIITTTEELLHVKKIKMGIEVQRKT